MNALPDTIVTRITGTGPSIEAAHDKARQEAERFAPDGYATESRYRDVDIDQETHFGGGTITTFQVQVDVIYTRKRSA